MKQNYQKPSIHVVDLVSIKARHDVHYDGLFDLSAFLLCF